MYPSQCICCPHFWFFLSLLLLLSLHFTQISVYTLLYVCNIKYHIKLHKTLYINRKNKKKTIFFWNINDCKLFSWWDINLILRINVLPLLRFICTIFKLFKQNYTELLCVLCMCVIVIFRFSYLIFRVTLNVFIVNAEKERNKSFRCIFSINFSYCSCFCCGCGFHWVRN